MLERAARRRNPGPTEYQIVVEPSLVDKHPGIPYLWALSPAVFPIQPAPAWLVDEILKVQGHRKSYPLPRDRTESGPAGQSPARGDAREFRPAPTQLTTPSGAAPSPKGPTLAPGAPSGPPLLGRMVSKYTLTGGIHGEHNDRMVRMGPEIIFGTKSDGEAYTVYEGWWNHYHRLGLCDAVDPARIERRISYLRRCQEVGKIQPPRIRCSRMTRSRGEPSGPGAGNRRGMERGAASLSPHQGGMAGVHLR
jgi:hypothetical protein